MLMTMHTASVEFGIPKATLYHQKKQVPMPVYIERIEISDKPDIFKINTDNPMWKSFVEDHRIDSSYVKITERKLKNLGRATAEVLNVVYAPTEVRLKEILTKIYQKYSEYEPQ